jgi:hypothetical protein
LSNSDIPLLTDIVEEDIVDEPEGSEAAHVRTQLIFPRPTDQTPTPHEHERFAIFEADSSRSRHRDASLVAADESSRPSDDSGAQSAAETSEPAEAPEASEADTVEIEDVETLIAELQTRLASNTFELMDTVMRAAFSDMEARIFREISTNLREQLPEMIDSVVRDHLQERRKQPEEGD